MLVGEGKCLRQLFFNLALVFNLVNVFQSEAQTSARAGKILQVLKNCVKQIRLQQ